MSKVENKSTRSNDIFRAIANPDVRGCISCLNDRLAATDIDIARGLRVTPEIAAEALEALSRSGLAETTQPVNGISGVYSITKLGLGTARFIRSLQEISR